MEGGESRFSFAHHRRKSMGECFVEFGIRSVLREADRSQVVSVKLPRKLPQKWVVDIGSHPSFTSWSLAAPSDSVPLSFSRYVTRSVTLIGAGSGEGFPAGYIPS